MLEYFDENAVFYHPHNFNVISLDGTNGVTGFKIKASKLHPSGRICYARWNSGAKRTPRQVLPKSENGWPPNR